MFAEVSVVAEVFRTAMFLVDKLRTLVFELCRSWRSSNRAAVHIWKAASVCMSRVPAYN